LLVFSVEEGECRLVPELGRRGEGCGRRDRSSLAIVDPSFISSIPVLNSFLFISQNQLSDAF
jgi:hypothetical protein